MPAQPDLRWPSLRRDRPLSLLLNTLASGGAQRRTIDLANRFAALGFTVEVVSVRGGGPMARLLSPAVTLTTLDEGMPEPRRNTGYAPALARHLRSSATAVMMSCVTDTHGLAVAAAGRTGVPVVLRASRHPLRPVGGGAWPRHLVETLKRWKARRTYRRADALVALGEDSRGGLQRLLGPAAPPVALIHNPVVDALRPRPASRLDPVPLILGIGRLVEQKDFATLLRAFADLRRSHPAQLTILGEGPLRGALAGLAASLGVADDVAMPGEVDDVPDWIDRAAVVVSSSRWEGLQATLIEALAAGCPVVATDCPGGARETLDGGRFGPLVAPGDSAGLARAIAGVLAAPLPPAHLAAAAARFTSPGKAEAYLDLFDNVVRASEARRRSTGA